jgi:GT2 family glycosyltransferase
MDISYVLLTWNSGKYIGKCLDSIFDDLEGRNRSFEIFISDNGSSDDTVPIIRSFQERYPNCIHLTCLGKNTGTTYPRNLALKQAKGRYIVIMDSDVELGKGIAAGLINLLKSDSRIGLAVPKLFYPSGSLQKSTDAFPTVFRKLFRYFFLKAIEKREDRLAGKTSPYPVDYAISALWMMKREVLETVGLLDENIFYSPEDVDYCLRVWQAGYRIVYHPQLSAVHHTQEISRGLRISAATLNHIKGLIYYFKKHRYFLRKPEVIES